MPVRRPGRVLVPTLATVLVIVLGLGATSCSGEDPPASGGEATPSATADPVGSAAGGGGLPVQVELGEVTGRMKPVVAKVTAFKVARVTNRWFEAAYLGGDYPRRSFTDAFPGFTAGAVRAARQDRTLMSNVAIAGDVESVTGELKAVEVDILGVDKAPAGATARFRLVFATTGVYARRVAVAGKLLLTLGPELNWRVFAYEVRRASSGPQGRAPATPTTTPTVTPTVTPTTDAGTR